MISNLSYLKTEGFLQESNAFAQQILDSNRDSRFAEATIHHHHTHSHFSRPAWGWDYYPQPVYYGVSPHSSYNGSDRDNKKRDHSWLAIPAAITALATLYFAGQNYSEWQQANAGISKIQEKMDKISEEISKSGSNEILCDSIHSVFEKQMAILQQIRSDAKYGLFWKGLLAGSCVAVITGAAFIEAPVLVTAGLVGGGISLGALLWRSGVRSLDVSLQTEARELQIAVSQARRVLDTIKA